MILLFDTEDFLEALDRAIQEREFIQDTEPDILDELSSYNDTSQNKQ